jgi:hypothetical protein
MQAQAYDLLAQADSIITACGGQCGGHGAIGDPAPVEITAPVAPGVVVTTEGMPIAPAPVEGGEVLVLKLAEKTASLAILDRVAKELLESEDEEHQKLASQVLDIASDLDKHAKIIEDGYDVAGTDDIRYVNEMEQGFQGGVIENGAQGGQGEQAIKSFETDRSAEVQSLPFLKVR